MNDINAAIEKIAEGLHEFYEAIKEAAEAFLKQVDNSIENVAAVFKELYEKGEQEKQKEPMRAKRPDYKQHIKAVTKPPYIKQIRKARKREALKK